MVLHLVRVNFALEQLFYPMFITGVDGYDVPTLFDCYFYVLPPNVIVNPANQTAQTLVLRTNLSSAIDFSGLQPQAAVNRLAYVTDGLEKRL
jgi:hypothetical protein